MRSSSLRRFLPTGACRMRFTGGWTKSAPHRRSSLPGAGQPASELVSNVTHRGRVVAAHFWYPPQLIPLVEVCAGPERATRTWRRGSATSFGQPERSR